MASQRRENLELVEPVHCVCGNISFRLNQVDFYPANILSLRLATISWCIQFSIVVINVILF